MSDIAHPEPERLLPIHILVLPSKFFFQVCSTVWGIPVIPQQITL
jgi:hypothetical protein